jgi:site-specific recombinase XerD
LGPQHIREYQAALFKKWKLAPNTVNQRLAALRFFYIQTLKRAWSVAETPYPKKVLKLPIILSQEEVTRLINSALTPFQQHHSNPIVSHFLQVAVSKAPAHSNFRTRWLRVQLAAEV